MGLSNLIRAILALFGRAPAPTQPEPQAVAPAEPDVAPSAPVVVAPQPAPPAPSIPVAPVVPVPVVPPPPRPAAPTPDISTPAGFIAAIAPAAQSCAKRTGVPASVTVAQAALESSWGKRAPGMNLFGIKADAAWHGPVTSQVTHEVENGQTITITANFRAYSTWQGSIDDHAAFLTGNPRYRPAFAFKDGPSFARAIAAAGYATDLEYAEKLISIMNARGLCALDSTEARA
ncbi:glycoside hydrolase family 73 protein [Burkholderia aenigmatica]|uniref:glycoside hydrolase family 73 protein n=1 Tax=Burkholderia aenigmatica TaxID=2015348 RepID=UPI00265727ED|nr:glucosaminidase domain-containing protein [Burkholderia aenigmatica]MDN7879325.1 glucosaminidase domain-containing protein [Burkholderia aenigmatica]